MAGHLGKGKGSDARHESFVIKISISFFIALRSNIAFNLIYVDKVAFIEIALETRGMIQLVSREVR